MELEVHRFHDDDDDDGDDDDDDDGDDDGHVLYIWVLYILLPEHDNVEYNMATKKINLS